MIPTEPILADGEYRYPADVYPNFGMTDQPDDRILRTIRGGAIQPGPVAAPNNFSGNSSGTNSGNESTWMPSTTAASSADPATQGATAAGPSSASVDLTGRSFASSGGGLFQSPSQSLQFVTGAAVSRAVEADASSRFFAGAPSTALTATEFNAAGAEGVQAYSTPMLSAADVQSALLDFHTGGDIDHASDGAGGIDSSLIDQALSRHGGLGGAESINARVSTELKPAEIGLGSVGIK
jgi:hypothetical protein